MKNTTILSVAAAMFCGALSFNAHAVGDEPSDSPDFPGYANPEFWIEGAKVKQSLTVSGCKAVSMPSKGTTLTTGNVTLFDDDSFVLYSDWSAKGGAGPIALTGQWTELKPNSKSSKTFYLSINTASMGLLLNDLQQVGLTNCQSTKPLMTTLDIVDPSVLVAKNTIVVKIKNNIATGSLLVKGSVVSDPKGPAGGSVIGKTQMKLTMTGFFNAAD